MDFLDKVYKAVGKNPNSIPDNVHTRPIKEKAVLSAIKSLQEPIVVKDSKNINELVAKLLKSEAVVMDLQEQLHSIKPNANLENKLRNYQKQLRVLSEDILNHPEFKKLRLQYEELLHQHDLDAKTIQEYFNDELAFKKDAKAHKKIANQLKLVIEQAELDSKTIESYFADEQKYLQHIAELVKTRSDLELELVKISGNYDAKIADKDKELAEKSEELNSYRKKLHVVNTKYELSEKHIADAQKKIDNLEADIAKIKGDRDNYSNQAKVYKDSLKSLSADYEEKSKEAQDNAIEAGSLRQDKFDLTYKLHDAEDKITSLEEKIAKSDSTKKMLKKLGLAAGIIASVATIGGFVYSNMHSEKPVPMGKTESVKNEIKYVPIFGIEDKK